jgi:hypothetical protein
MIRINYFNPVLQIGLTSWREAWLLTGKYPEKLYTELYRNCLVFRIGGCNRRISYRSLKKGMVKKALLFLEEPLPF